MTDINYPQRWLREAEAITSPEGWRKEKTNELLKCQKGLEELYPPDPELISVNAINVPLNVNLDTVGNGSYSFGYEFIESNYEPINVTCEITKTGNATVVPTINKIARTVEIEITGADNNDAITTIIDIDGIKSQSNVTQLIVPPSIKSVTIGNVQQTVNLNDSGVGTFTFPFTFEDDTYVPNSITCETTLTGSGSVTPTVNKEAKTIKIDIAGVARNTTTKIDLVVNIDGVKSPSKSINAVGTPYRIETVTIGNVQQTVNLNDSGVGTFTFPFTYTEANYEPTSITCETSLTGTGTATATVDKAAKTIKVDIAGVTRNTTTKIDLVVNIDGVKSAKKSINAIAPNYRIETVTLGTVPASINLNDSGVGSFTVPYTYTEANYEPTSITCSAVVTGSGSATATVNKEAKTIKVDVTGVNRQSTSKVDLVVDIDGVKSPSKSTNAIAPNYRIETVTLGDVPENITVNDTDNTGTIEFSYSFVEPQYTPNNVVCNTTSTTAVLTPVVDKVAKTVTVSVTNATVEDEEIGFELEIDGVKSAIKKSLIKIVATE